MLEDADYGLAVDWWGVGVGKNTRIGSNSKLWNCHFQLCMKWWLDDCHFTIAITTPYLNWSLCKRYVAKKLYSVASSLKFCFEFQVKFPNNISMSAKDLLGALLRKNPKERLGGGPADVKEVMNHSFFSFINWEDLLQRRVRILGSVLCSKH